MRLAVPKTIRAKIAWLTGILSLVVVIGYGSVLYFSLRSQLYRTVDIQLSARAEALSAAVDRTDGQLRFAFTDGAPPTRQDELVALLVSPSGSLLDTLGSDAVAAQLSLDDQAPGFETLPFIEEEEDEDDLRPDTEMLRLLTTPLPADGAPIAYLKIGQDLDPQQDALSRLLSLLLITGPVLVGLAALGGYWLARQALVPIEQIRSQAAAIHASDLGRRLSTATTGDEVSRLAGTFNQMLDRLQGSFRRQLRFTADASHELRTPLSIIRSEIDVTLEQLRAPGDYIDALESIGEETQRMSRLVNELLALARADVDELRLDIETVDLAELLQVLVEQMEHQAGAAGVEIKAELPPSLSIQGDRDRLLELFINLLENAFIHAPGSRVTATAAVEGADVVVRVADTGPGIPEADLPHIFERFYRADQARDRKGAGSGLGLAIAQEIAQAHGGHISVTSRPQQGATFAVRLPSMRASM